MVCGNLGDCMKGCVRVCEMILVGFCIVYLLLSLTAYFCYWVIGRSHIWILKPPLWFLWWWVSVFRYQFHVKFYKLSIVCRFTLLPNDRCCISSSQCLQMFFAPHKHASPTFPNVVKVLTIFTTFCFVQNICLPGHPQWFSADPILTYSDISWWCQLFSYVRSQKMYHLGNIEDKNND